MTQLPTIPIPSGQVQAPQISPGPDIFGPIARVAETVLGVQRNRKIAEGRTQLIKTMGEAVEQADSQSTFEEAVSAFSAGMDPLADQFGQIRDGAVRNALTSQLNFERERTMISVRRNAAKREGMAALAAENTRFDEALQAGGDPEELSGDRREALEDLSPTVLNPLQVAEQVKSSDLRIARRQFNVLQDQNPQDAIDFLETPFANKAIPSDELDAKKREAGRELKEHQSKVFENLFTQQREELFKASQQDGPRAFNASITESAKQLAGLPGTNASAEEIRVALLRDTLRAYALQGLPDQFNMVADAMGDSLDATTEINRQRATLRSAQNQNRSLDQAIFDIQGSASMGFPLEKNKARQDAVDLMFANMVQNGLDPLTEEGMNQVFKAFGNSTILPTPVTRMIQSVLLRPENHDAGTITQITTMGNRLRTQHDGAWDRFGEETKALLRTYNRLHTIGGNAKADYQLAWDSTFEIKQLSQAEVASRQSEWRRFSAGEFLDLVKDELEFKIPRTAEQRIFAGIEEGAELPDPRILGDLLPSGLLEQFSAIFEAHKISGMSSEAAISKAWEAVSKDIGVTSVFRDPAIVRLAPERTSGGKTDDQIEEDVSFALFRDLALGNVQMPAASVKGQRPFMRFHGPLGQDLVADDPKTMNVILKLGVPNAVRVSNFNELTTWGKDRLRLVASRSEQLMTEQGGELLYRLVLIDDDGVEHTIMRKNQAGEFGPYLVSMSGGYSQAEARRQFDIDVSKAQEREKRRRPGLGITTGPPRLASQLIGRLQR